MNNISNQQALIKLGLLDPPADGKWGPLSQQALLDFQSLSGLQPSGKFDEPTLKALSVAKFAIQLGSDFASKIVKYMLAQGYFVAVGAKRYNIVYVEGVNENGLLNSDTFNQWNDRRLIIEVDQVPKIVGNWIATTEPGAAYTYNPMNARGAFRIAFGQYKAWRFGLHGRSQYPALVQCASVSGYRDKDKNGVRTGDLLVTGDNFGINQHHGGNSKLVDWHSAGCLVGQSIGGHHEFLEILKGDRRYQINPSYIFYTTIIAGDKLALS
jgi:hypothetical protein